MILVGDVHEYVYTLKKKQENSTKDNEKLPL